MEIKYNCVYDLFADSASNHYKKTALYCQNEKLRYDDLLSFVNRVAAFMQKFGIKKGDKVGIFMENSWEYIVAVYAILATGAIVVPIDCRVKSKELSFILDDSNIVFLFSSDSLRNIVAKSIAIHRCKAIVWVGNGTRGIRFRQTIKEDLEFKRVDLSLEDEAFIFYTSGTQGKPKGAILTNKNVLTSLLLVKNHINLREQDRVILFLSLDHSFVLLFITILPLSFGASIVLHKYSGCDDLLKEITLKRVTILFSVPLIYNQLVNAEINWLIETFNKLRLLVCGGSAIDKNIAIALNNKFNKAKFIEGYGLTESSAIVSANPLNKPKFGSVGVPLNGVKVKIVDSYDVELPSRSIGEIIVSGDNVMKCYINIKTLDECRVKNGWLYTGDLGYLDEDGYLYIVDRKKDLIISKEGHIYPREVEEIINNFEGVKESAVVGKELNDGYEEPVAFLVQSSQNLINIDNLKNYLKGFLANYKIPKEYIVIEELPRNSRGKILKRELKQMLKKQSGRV